jgi:hypothetical protein
MMIWRTRGPLTPAPTLGPRPAVVSDTASAKVKLNPMD